MRRISGFWIFCLASTLLGAPLAAAGSADAAAVDTATGDLTFHPRGPIAGSVLTISGPEGFSSRQLFSADAIIRFEVGADLQDGAYTYELVLSPKLDAETRRSMARARQEGDESAIHRLRAAGKLPSEPQVVSGTFTVSSGALVPADLREEGAGGDSPHRSGAAISATSDESGLSHLAAADQVIPDDLIVTGSICTGFDCVNGEDFGFDTIRLKENNLRIRFFDTSVGAFPTRDWQLVANDSASGGANRFSIEDIDGARTPFTLTAGAPTNSVFVDSTGRVGLGTSTPVLNAHIASGNTPALRLEQNGSSGFSPQTWDVAGNEVNFFVRDVTGGSQLPLRIQPGAPSNSLFVRSTGDVGIGTASPAAGLDIIRSTGAASVLLQLTNNDPVAIQFNNTDLAQLWQIRRSASGLTFDGGANANNLFFDDGRVRLGAGAAGAESFLLAANGNLAIAGTLSQNSDRDKKTHIQPVAEQEILDRVMRLPIATWRYRHDSSETTHLGPMAQDFHALFGLGIDDRHIAAVDTSGVALAAIQALGQRLEAKQVELETLKAQNSALLARLEALEAKLAP